MKQVAISMHNKFHSEIHHFCEGANSVQKQVEFRHILLPENEQKLFAGVKIRAEEACKVAFSLKRKHRLKVNDVFIVFVDGDLWDHAHYEYFSVTNLDYPRLAKKYPGLAIISSYYLNSNSEFMRDCRVRVEEAERP